MLLTAYTVYGRMDMNEAQERIAVLQQRGWTLAAIADEMEVTVNAVEKWKEGSRFPANAKATLTMLDGLAKRKLVPKRRRYLNERPSTA